MWESDLSCLLRNPLLGFPPKSRTRLLQWKQVISLTSTLYLDQISLWLGVGCCRGVVVCRGAIEIPELISHVLHCPHSDPSSVTHFRAYTVVSDVGQVIGELFPADQLSSWKTGMRSEEGKTGGWSCPSRFPCLV